MNPNSALSAWQLTIMAVVPVALLFAWLIAIFIAAREPVRRDLTVAVSPGESVTAGTGSSLPEQPPTDRMAA